MFQTEVGDFSVQVSGRVALVYSSRFLCQIRLSLGAVFSNPDVAVLRGIPKGVREMNLDKPGRELPGMRRVVQ